MNRFGNMSVNKSSDKVIPILPEFIQKHIMNMLQYHFEVSNCNAKENNLLKSEVESLRGKALASAKDTEMDDKAKMEDIQDNTRWCWFYNRNTGLDFLERSVEEKLGTANTLFLWWMSIKLHLKVWNSFCLYTNASPEEMEEVKKIYTQEEIEKRKRK
jgi:hypothetical protein